MSSSSSSSAITVHLWCGPRSMSTCTLYAFGNRDDTLAVDEPLYASYLAKRPHLFRPYREELMKAQSSDGSEVLRLLKPENCPNPEGKKVIFCKNLAKQLVGVDRTNLYGSNIKNIILIRDPYLMISSWEEKTDIHKEPCTLESTCLLTLVELFSELRQANGGVAPIVVDSDLLRNHPREVLTELCSRLDIPFDERQMNWPSGPKSFDGLWAPHWYDQVWSSSGFNSFTGGSSDERPRQNNRSRQYIPLGPEQIEIYRECLPFYNLLRRHAIGVDSVCPGSSVPPVNLSLTSSSSISRTASKAKNPYISRRTMPTPDVRNENILVWVSDRLVPREMAKVSVFDSAVQGGDAVWEGLRVYDGRVFMLDEHLQRLQDSAKAMAFQNVPSNDFIKHAIISTLAANNMRSDCHIRLTLTRGAKITSSMNPIFNVFGCNLIVLAEWKPLQGVTTYNNSDGIKLITATGRRNSAQCVDSKIHHCNLINNILPKIQANNGGAADALMLDTEGFVSETNATNVFCIKDGVVYTPHADSCLPGVTRANVMDICRRLQIQICEKRISLTEFYTADEAFTTGTMGGITPICEIDARPIGYSDGGATTSTPTATTGATTSYSNGSVGGGMGRFPIISRIQEAYKILTETNGFALPPY